MAAPTVTTTSSPPVVHIVFQAEDLNASTNSITLYAIADGVTRTVRSAINLFAVGGTVTDDTEAPAGVPITYRAQQFDASGAELGYTDSTTVTVPSLGPIVGYVSNPLDATSTVQVTMADGAGSSPTRVIPGTLHRAGFRTIALVGTPGLLTSQNMDFYTETQADYDAVMALINDAGGLILIRTDPAFRGIPRLLYCWASKTVPNDLQPGEEPAIWSNTVDETTAPTGDLTAALIPWQIYIDAFPTWADFNSAYLTWFDAMQNPPTGGS